MRCLIPAALLALAGCSTTSAVEIRSREVQDEVTVPGRSVAQMRDCLVSALGVVRQTVETGTDERREIIFSTLEAGAIFHYILEPQEAGVKVTARRKNAVADGFNEGRKCYQGAIVTPAP